MAEIVESGDYWTLDDDGVLRINYIGDLAFIFRRDGAPWYPYRDDIRSAIVEEVTGGGRTGISIGAFADCRYMETVTLSSTVYDFAIQTAFIGCERLKSITVDSAATDLSSIDGVLYNKDGTTLIYWPTAKSGTFPGTFAHIRNGVTTIRSGAFAVSDSNYTVDEPGWYEVTNPLTSVRIPASVTTIERGAFFEADALNTVIYEGTAEEWAEIEIEPTENQPLFTARKIYAASPGTEVIASGTVWPSGWEEDVEDMGLWVLDDSGTLTITMNGYMPNMGPYDYPVWNKHNPDFEDKIGYVRNIIINDGVTTISECAFSGCYNLESVTIPASVQTIEFFAFGGFDDFETGELYPLPITDIYYSGTETDWNNIEVDPDVGEAFFSATVHFGGETPETPVITVQPVGGTYTISDTPEPLSIAATVTDGGTLSYQWYSNTTNEIEGGIAIPDAMTTSYMPSTEEVKTTYYYCVVTNTKGDFTDTVTSDIAAISVVALLPVYFDGVAIPYLSKWEEKYDVVETTAVTERGTDVVILTRLEKLTVSAGGTLLSKDVALFEAFRTKTTFQLTLSGEKTSRTVRMRNFSKTRKAKSEKLKVTAGIWSIRFDLIEI